VGDGSIDSGQEAATFVGIKFPSVGHHVVENMLRDGQIRHD